MFDLIGANMLGDTTRLTFSHIRMPDSVQKGSFPMINMAQDSDYRRSAIQITWIFIKDEASP